MTACSCMQTRTVAVAWTKASEISVGETCEVFALIPPFTGSTSPLACPTTLKCTLESTTSVYVQPPLALDQHAFHAPCPAVCRACSPRARSQRQRPAGWPGVADCWPTGCRRRRKHCVFAGTTAQSAAAACRHQQGAGEAEGAARQHQVPNPQDGCWLY